MPKRITGRNLWSDRVPTSLNSAIAGATLVAAALDPSPEKVIVAALFVALAVACTIFD